MRAFLPYQRFVLPNELLVRAKILLVCDATGDLVYEVSPRGVLVEPFTGKLSALDSDDLDPVPTPPTRRYQLFDPKE